MDKFKAATTQISIHALREEGDQVRTAILDGMIQFLSTPSARRATKTGNRIYMVVKISIHALREEGDATASPRPSA